MNKMSRIGVAILFSAVYAVQVRAADDVAREVRWGTNDAERGDYSMSAPSAPSSSFELRRDERRIDRVAPPHKYDPMRYREVGRHRSAALAAPELDAATGAAALTLLVGGLVVLRGRTRAGSLPS